MGYRMKMGENVTVLLRRSAQLGWSDIRADRLAVYGIDLAGGPTLMKGVLNVF
jgi:hypothetical protein